MTKNTGNAKFATIILAAGLSSRMGRLKALMDFAGDTAIRRVIEQAAGVGRVVVVTGHESEAIAQNVQDLPVEICENEKYLQGMFTSVQAGVGHLAQNGGADAFFLLPVDYTLVTADIMKRLAQEFLKSRAPVVYPSFCGKKGHPPLISSECVNGILSYEGNEGLKGALLTYAQRAQIVETDAPAILDDMDTMEDYRRMVAIGQNAFAYRHIFIQGDIYVGKSTLIEEQTAGMKKELGGFRVKRGYSKNGRCNQFFLESVQEALLPVRKQTAEAERVFMSKREEGWRFVPEVFENFATSLLERERRRGFSLFLLDEVGGMELQCHGFARELHSLLADRGCVGVFKQLRNSQAQSDAMDMGAAYQYTRGLLVEQIVRTGGKILTLEHSNRENIAEELRNFLETRSGGEFARLV